MSTLGEIQAAAATLPAEQRSELAAWLSSASDVRDLKKSALRQEIRAGLEAVSRGCVAPLNMADIKRKARADWASGSDV